jgi:hypothetical protein
LEYNKDLQSETNKIPMRFLASLFLIINKVICSSLSFFFWGLQILLDEKNLVNHRNCVHDKKHGKAIQQQAMKKTNSINIGLPLAIEFAKKYKTVEYIK